MKNVLFVPLLLAAALVGGCATHRETLPPVTAANPPKPLSLAEIREMSAAGVSDETILAALRASRAVYHLSARDLAALREARVRPAVIEYLLKTPELYKERRTVYRTDDNFAPPAYWYWHNSHWVGFHGGWHH